MHYDVVCSIYKESEKGDSLVGISFDRWRIPF